MLQHLVNHGSYHRGQLTTMFRQLGAEPAKSMDLIRYYREKLDLSAGNAYGFKATFNPTFPERGRNKWGWVSPHHYGINQGPILIMVENYRTQLVWKLMRGCPYVVEGLRRAGFSGGWL